MIGADSRRNDRADRKYAASNYGVIERAKKKRRNDNASISDICRKVVVSCGVQCGGGGGEFCKNITLCGSRREKSSDNAVVGKR